MKKIVFIGLLLVFFNSCSQKEQPKEQFKRLSPRIEKEILNYIKENNYEKDSSKIIMVYVNSLFKITKIVIEASNSILYKDSTYYPYKPDIFYELQDKAVLIYNGTSRFYDSKLNDSFEKFMLKYDKNLAHSSTMFSPPMWILKIEKDSFNLEKQGNTLEYQNELQWFSPTAPPPPLIK